MHTVLPFPYPFKSMVAIESDIDRTSLPRFRQTLRFLSTHAETPLGRGLGLDFANSFWCYRRAQDSVSDDASDEVGYWAGFDDPKQTPHARELIRYAQAGRIGALHSYGRFDDSFTRDHAARALDMLDREGAQFRIWTNHGRFHAQNIATALSPHEKMMGGRPGEAAHHVDLLRDYGVRYFWPTGYRGRSEGTKTPLHLTELEDGSKVWQFVRSSVLFLDVAHFDLFARKGSLFGGNNRWPGAVGWQPQMLGLWLSEARLNRLVDQGLYCVFAQHLGNQLGAVHFAPDAANGLRRLKAYQDRGQILVASTERLLDYHLAVTHAAISTTSTADADVVEISQIDDPAGGAFKPSLNQVRGMSVALPKTASDATRPVRLIVGGNEIMPSAYRVVDEPDRRIVIVPWHAADTTDYAAEFDATSPSRYRGLDPAPATQNGAVTMADRVFTANEAGFAGRPSAITVGADANAWAAALEDLGTPATTVSAENFASAAEAGVDAAKRMLAGARPAAAVLSLPAGDIGFAGAFDVIRQAAPPTCPRLIQVSTIAGALRQIADYLRGDSPEAAAKLAAEMAASELRRLGPHTPAGGPRLPRDRAEAERALVWADLGYYGDIMPRAGDADLLGVRDYGLMAAPPATGGAHNLTALCRRHVDFGDGFEPIRRHLDGAAEVFGGTRALEILPRNAAAALGAALQLRQACYTAPAPAASAFDDTAAMAQDLTDRLLVARTHGGAIDPDKLAAFLDRDGATAEGAALAGWLRLGRNDAEAARADFERATDWAPEDLGAAAGLIAAMAAEGGPSAIADAAPTIERALAAAERAAVAERIGFSRPTSRPRDELI